jgi:hypothetical protein
MVVLQKIVPYDDINHAPAICSLITHGIYSSMPMVTPGTNYIFYDGSTSTRIFNSNAVDENYTFILGTTDKELMIAVIESIKNSIANLKRKPDD